MFRVVFASASYALATATPKVRHARFPNAETRRFR